MQALEFKVPLKGIEIDVKKGLKNNDGIKSCIEKKRVKLLDKKEKNDSRHVEERSDSDSEELYD